MATVDDAKETRPTPELADLHARLAEIFGVERERLTIDRRKDVHSGTFPKEIVWCLLDGRPVNVFCKYAAERFTAFGHRGGIPYEAEVYRSIVSTLPLSAPRMIGMSEDEQWLVLEYLDGAERLDFRWRDIGKVAAWMGHFHALSDERPSFTEQAFLSRYDADYYRGWAERTAAFAGHWHRAVPWLAPLCDYFAEHVPLLDMPPPTVIHGEFTIHNCMVRGEDEVLVTDWESAAVAVGEIDLMCLVDAWNEQDADVAIEAYVEARWQGEPPPDFDARREAAELYLHFRWLGEDPELMLGRKRVWRFERLEQIAAGLGIHA